MGNGYQGPGRSFEHLRRHQTTGYLRDYLVQNCNLEDRRNDPLISAKWNRIYGNYEIAEKKKMKKINGDDTMNSLENLLAEGGTKKEVQD